MTLPAVEDPRRLHYLDAMGLSAWTARYRLPNAAPTPVSEWHSQEVAAPQPPAQRLQALLDEPAPSRAAPPDPTTDQASPALLQEFRRRISPAHEKTREEATKLTAEAEKAVVQQEPLRFTLQLGALEGRWLVILTGDTLVAPPSMRFLRHLLFAADLPASLPVLQTFRWPMMEELPVEEPLEEAREGLAAFLEGRKRHGWRIERLLIFGESPALTQVLASKVAREQEEPESECPLSKLPAWQLPSLEDLMQGADAKRALWPRLGEWRRQWHVGMEDTQSDA